MICSNDLTSSFVALESKGQVEHNALWDKVCVLCCILCILTIFWLFHAYKKCTCCAVHSIHTTYILQKLKDLWPKGMSGGDICS